MKTKPNTNNFVSFDLSVVEVVHTLSFDRLYRPEHLAYVSVPYTLACRLALVPADAAASPAVTRKALICPRREHFVALCGVCGE